MIEEVIASGAVSREQVERELGQPLEPASETPDEKNAADDQEKPPVPEEKNP